MNKEQGKKLIMVALILIFIVVVSFIAKTNNDENLSIAPSSAITLSKNWTLHYGESIQQEAHLPVDLNLAPGTLYEAHMQLPAVEDKMNYLLLRSSMQDIVVYLEDEEIYRLVKPHKEGFEKTVASVWILVKLPEHFQEKNLKLVFTSEVEAFSGVINEVKLADSATLMYQIFKNSFSGLVTFLLLFITGLLIAIISLITKSVQSNKFLYLGLFAVSTSIWILSETRIMQFFTGNRYIIGAISYLMVPCIGIFFCLYVKDAILIKKQHKQFMQVGSLMYLSLLIVMILLQLLGVSTFIELFQYILTVMLFNSVVIFIMMVQELISQKNKNVKQFFKYISVLFVSLLLEGLTFYIHQFKYTSSFLRIGILAFFGLVLVDAYYCLKKSLEEQQERHILEKLAYKDFLTGAYNRAAFERDLDQLINKQQKDFRLILLDLNGLKYINDYYGHGCGDEAIKIVYNTIYSVFSPFGECYRIGGDEFAIIMQQTGKELFEIRMHHFRKYIEQEDRKLPYPLDVAVGADVYNIKTWGNYRKFYHHVDQKMYADKLKRKNNKTIF